MQLVTPLRLWFLLLLNLEKKNLFLFQRDVSAVYLSFAFYMQSNHISLLRYVYLFSGWVAYMKTTHSIQILVTAFPHIETSCFLFSSLTFQISFWCYKVMFCAVIATLSAAVTVNNCIFHVPSQLYSVLFFKLLFVPL